MPEHVGETVPARQACPEPSFYAVQGDDLIRYACRHHIATALDEVLDHNADRGVSDYVSVAFSDRPGGCCG